MFQFGGYDFPQLMMLNLGQITAADPFFDSAGFLSFAQGAYWKIHQATAAGDLDPVRNMLSEPMLMQLQRSSGQPIWRDAIQSLEQASILNVAHDASFDTVTVRVGSRSTAKKRNDLVEDWTFQRPAASWGASSSAPPVTQCPSCGAPVSTDEHGNCRYCNVPIKGVVGDWRLVSTNIPTVQKATSGGGCGMSGFVIFIVLVTVVVPLIITAVVLYEVNKTTDSAFSGFNNNFGFPASSTTTRVKGNSLDGSLTFTGGLNGSPDLNVLSTPGGDVGSCASRSANVTGIDATSTADNQGDGLSEQYVVTVAFPEGKKGPGTYTDATVNVVFHETPLAGSTPASTPANNTWASGQGSTVSATLTGNNSGTVTFSGLLPTDPQWKALGGNMTFTCS
jgi:hypothetical protein